MLSLWQFPRGICRGAVRTPYAVRAANADNATYFAARGDFALHDAYYLVVPIDWSRDDAYGHQTNRYPLGLHLRMVRNSSNACTDHSIGLY
jgi:hypothetical protein